jgi:hypothetical protein
MNDVAQIVIQDGTNDLHLVKDEGCGGFRNATVTPPIMATSARSSAKSGK